MPVLSVKRHTTPPASRLVQMVSGCFPKKEKVCPRITYVRMRGKLIKKGLFFAETVRRVGWVGLVFLGGKVGVG